MRVLVCSQGFPRHPEDHHAPFILDHARALVGAGVEVTVLCPSAPGLAATETFGDVAVVRFRYAPRRWELLGYSGAMHQLVRGPHALLLPFFMVGYLVAAVRLAARVEVVHGHWWAPSGLVAVLAGRLRGVPAVVHIHGTDAALGARRGVRWLARWVLRRADAVLVASSALGAWVASATRGRVEAVVAPMPLDPGRVPAPSPPPAAGPVLAIGRLVPEKGFDVLIRAVAETGDRLVLVGDGGRRGELESLASSTGATVDFRGVVAPAELASLYASARVVAVPSRREGFGMVAAEALAAGRPVVASAVGGLSDVVADGKTGILVPADDVSALVAGLRSVSARFGQAGPASVEWLTPAAIAGRNIDVYRRAVAAAAGRRAMLPVLVRALSVAFVLVSGILFYLALRDQWGEARTLSLSWSAGPVAVAIGAVAVAHLLLSGSWVWLLKRLGGAISWAAGLRVFWTGQLGRYLPTGLGAVPARVALAARHGVPARTAATATAAEPVVVVGVCGSLAALLLPGWLGLVGPVAGLLATAALAVRVLRRAGVTGALGYVAAQGAQLALKGVAVLALLRIAGGEAQPSTVEAVGAVCLAYLLGTVAVFAPGGIGVREAALVGALGETAGVAPAAAAGVLLRLLELALEVPFLGLTRLVRASQPSTSTSRAAS